MAEYEHPLADPGWVEHYALRSFSGDLAFDIGAQTGSAAVAMAGNFKRIVAVEPAAESFKRLLEWDDIPGLIPLLSAVSDHSGTIELAEQPGPMAVFTLTDGSERWGPVTRWRTVPCITVDDLARQYGPPDLVKVDTEGWELHIIKGALETIQAVRPNLYIEVHDARNGEEIQKLIDPIYGEPERFDMEPARDNYYWLVWRRPV